VKNIAMKDAPSIDPAEIAKFSALADEWWDPAGTFAPLHKFNPVRLRFLKDFAARHFKRCGGGRPFQGLTLLDVGCGGGLVAEPMAEAGFAVTGVDASEKNVAAAKAHAGTQNIAVDYRLATAEDLAAAGETFDMVLALEIVEHVADLDGFLAAAAKLVRPGGLMAVASLNKTLKSLALAKVGAEYVLGWLPKGSHDWSRFVPPERVEAMLAGAGLKPLTRQGVAFDPLAWKWVLSGDTAVNYMVVSGR
jgi:2-polyprenyl-6-hydroxyphenyl methylase / 3-demethylubiquinone-9 3-methyltransferase